MRTTSRLAVALLLLSPGLALAAVPGTLAFSARVSDNGRPVTGAHAFVFTLWNCDGSDPSTCVAGTNDLWAESQSLQAKDGVVATVLGADAANPLPAEIFGAALFLDVKMDGTAFGQRLALHSVPYAVRVALAEEAAIAQSIADGTVLPSKLAGTAGTAGQVPSKGTGDAWAWKSVASESHTHPGAQVTSAVTEATHAANATTADALASSATIPASQISGTVASASSASSANSLASSATITGSQVSGTVSSATYAANLGPSGSGWTQSTFGTAGTVNTGSNPVDWTKLKGVPAAWADGADTTGPTLATCGQYYSTVAVGANAWVSVNPATSCPTGTHPMSMSCYWSGGIPYYVNFCYSWTYLGAYTKWLEMTDASGGGGTMYLIENCCN